MQLWLGNCGVTDLLLNPSTQPILKVSCQIVTRFSTSVCKQVDANSQVSGFGRYCLIRLYWVLENWIQICDNIWFSCFPVIARHICGKLSLRKIIFTNINKNTCDLWPMWVEGCPPLMQSKFSYNLKKLFDLFIFGCAGSSLLHGLFSSCREWGLLSSCNV